MNEETKYFQSHYERVVTYFINQYRYKANLVSYNDFITGYSLFEIGKKLDLKTSLNELAYFLQIANVIFKSDLEQEEYYKIIADIQTSLEELNQSRM